MKDNLEVIIMINKILSIIIPTYNMERYLKLCLDSLLVGEKIELLDVLVVNDGSGSDYDAIFAEATAHNECTLLVEVRTVRLQ